MRREKRPHWARLSAAGCSLAIVVSRNAGLPSCCAPPRQVRLARSDRLSGHIGSACRAVNTRADRSATGRKDGSEQQRDQDNDDDQRAQSDRDIPAHKALLCMAFVQSAIVRRDGSRLDSAACAARGPPLIGEPQSSDFGLPVIRPRQLVARV